VVLQLVQEEIHKAVYQGSEGLGELRREEFALNDLSKCSVDGRIAV
jgi:hypothetical protein